MSGNIHEWCHDCYAKYDSKPSVNPQGPGKGDTRVLRGGWYEAFPAFCHLGFRYDYGSKERHTFTGFRLAFSEKP